MNILITGSKGFIGKNLVNFIRDNFDFNVIEFSKGEDLKELNKKILIANFIIHLAGVNRPKDETLFAKVNIDLTKYICDYLSKKSLKTPIIFSSSIQASEKNSYGLSKYTAEELLKNLNKINNNNIFIYRLPGVFGKWCKPNYNSVVSTFCYNVINKKTLTLDNPKKNISLVYIDDVIENFCTVLNSTEKGLFFPKIEPEYKISIKRLAETIQNFYKDRENFKIDNVGSGLTRKLYSTFISYLNDNQFSYSLKENIDERGKFIEILKTNNSGQFSFFTAYPGITRGGHYHNTKTEKFLVIHGKAEFKFKNLITGSTKNLVTDADNPIIVDTIPGWVHNIKNIGSEELKVLLWSNENFDKNKPDTYQKEI